MSAQDINFVIIHGTLGSPDINWFPWLKQKLEQDGHRVFAPAFPTPDGQCLAAWAALADKILKDIDAATTVLVGHSMGALFALYLAENADKPYKAVFALCPFMEDLALQPYDTLNATFTHHAFEWSRVNRNAHEIFCWAGDNDPYVPLAYSQTVADKCGTALLVIKNGGHLNSEAGYTSFPLLLDKIREVIGA